MSCLYSLPEFPECLSSAKASNGAMIPWCIRRAPGRPIGIAWCTVLQSEREEPCLMKKIHRKCFLVLEMVFQSAPEINHEFQFCVIANAHRPQNAHSTPQPFDGLSASTSSLFPIYFCETATSPRLFFRERRKPANLLLNIVCWKHRSSLTSAMARPEPISQDDCNNDAK